MVSFESLDMVSYSPSIITMATSSIISEIKQLVENCNFLMPIFIQRSHYGGPHQIVAILFGAEKQEWYG